MHGYVVREPEHGRLQAVNDLGIRCPVGRERSVRRPYGSMAGKTLSETYDGYGHTIPLA